MDYSTSALGVQGMVQSEIARVPPNQQILAGNFASAQPLSPLPTGDHHSRQEQIRQKMSGMQIALDDPINFVPIDVDTPDVQRKSQTLVHAHGQSFSPVATAVRHLQQQERIRHENSFLQNPSNDPVNSAPVPIDTGSAEMQKKKKKSRASIEWTADVLDLAVHVIYTIKLWDVNARKTMKVMETRNRGVQLFVQNIAHKFGVKLVSNPVWGTIENAVNKMLNMHRAQRNREKNIITGGGDRDGDELESTEDRNKRMSRERFYDTMLSMRETFNDWKQVCFSNS